jgi:hypothetical protein
MLLLFTSMALFFLIKIKQGKKEMISSTWCTSANSRSSMPQWWLREATSKM